MKTVHIDHLLKIGKTHKICEDYIISGYDPVPYIILSDGCSSSKNTDIGARILCHRAKQYLQRYTNSFNSINGIEMGDYIIWSSKLAIDLLGLDVTALDATLIITYYYDGLININMYGDGCIVVIDKTSTMIETVEYSKNTPYYLSYKLDYERNEIYHSNKITKMVDKRYYYNSPDSTDLITGTMDYDEPCISKYLIEPNRDKTIFILSDGISTFFNKEQTKFLSIIDLIKDFSSFKTLKGEFLQRRLLSKKGAITKLEQQGYDHLDDLSIGAFVIGED
jgi:Protein phosphatase 2C